MYVYIIFKNALRRIQGVTLRNFSVPECCGVLKERLDPSLWFKVLVLDSLLVDCDQKNVFYNKENPSEKEDIHGYRKSMLAKDLVHGFFRDKESVFSEEDSPEYDPTFDELFGTAVKILQDEPENGDQETTYEHLFKLLHVFVLPKIKLDRKDQASVTKILNDIEIYHIETENEIQMSMKSERNTESSLNEQTKQLLRKEEEFGRPAYVAACHHEFISIFLERLDKYIAKCRDDIEIFTAKITPIRDSVTEEDMRKLRLLRSERNMVKEWFDKAIVVREEIRKSLNQHSSVHENINQLSFGFQNSYVQTYRCLQMRQQEVPKMIRTKIKISAVREAVILTLKEVDTDGYSYGYNRVKGSFDAESNILDLNQVPDEWASLPAKVKHLLENPEFDSQHSQFCNNIKSKCQNLLRASGAVRLKPGNFLLDNTAMNSYASRWSSGSISKDSCESICMTITSHISQFAEKLSLSDDLVKDYEVNPQSTRDKVYMCYGEKVTAELMPILSTVYEESYRTLTHDLTNFLATAPINELFSGEIKMLNKLMSKQNHRPPSKTTHGTEEECVYDTVRYEDQRASLPTHQTESGYESMAYLHARMRQENMFAAIPEAHGVSAPEHDKTDTTSCRQSQTTISRKRGISVRKRDGLSLTLEQADKLMAAISKGDSWYDMDGYVNMNTISATRQNSTSSLNRLYMEFTDFQLLVKEEISASTMSAKLRSMTGILRYVESKLSDLKIKAGDSEPACADDLISVIILLLLKLNSEDLLKLYAHIHLLDHLCPNFMMGNIHSYALVSLQGPYHMLFEQAKLRQSH